MRPTVERPTSSRWKLREPDPTATERIARAHRLSGVCARALVNRGFSDVEEVRAHLSAALTDLCDPFLLPDMKRACERVVRAVRGGETILVHGDYDVDGVTGTALLMRLFRELGANAEWHIPNRFTDGYSFGEHSLERAEECGADVVISVDNGTSARETIAALAARGIDVIVTDHHEPPPGELPRAHAIVNPKLDDSRYPFRELCGGAVAFKLAWGICQEFEGTERVSDRLRRFLVEAMAYVAIATVCDVVPIVGENRILARYGLRALERTTHEGLRALLTVAELSGRALTSEDVGFKLGPRINASGRLGTAHTAVELALCDDPREALTLARRLDELNQERKAIERGVLEEALEAARPFEDATRFPVILVAGEGWHQGVVGIVAARLVERYARPAIVVGLEGDEGRGSARSVPGFDVLQALHGGGEHMIRYGGHEQAAGCEVAASSIDALRESVCGRARELLDEKGFAESCVDVDAELPFAEMTSRLMRDIERLAPFGPGNEAVVLVSHDATLAEPPRRLGADQSHLALRLRSGGHVLKAMAFGRGERASEVRLGSRLSILFRPKWNTFRGETNLELELLDFEVQA